LSAEVDATLLDAVRFSAASNSWVVAGDRSTSGKPLAANDPHLAHMLPSLFHPQHLRSPGLDVIGVTAPGLPWILSGHNEHVAWGMTSAVGDAVDLYVEKTDPARPGEVLTSRGWKSLEVEDQVIRIRTDGKLEERRIPIRRSAHGPILNDLYPRILPPGTPLLALRWTPRAVHASLPALLAAARTRTVEEFRRAVLPMATPATTWTAADDTGSIALFVTGDLPVRPHHLGTFPVPGWVDAYEWQDPGDPARMPSAVSRTGVLAHANNLVRNPDRSDVFVNVDAAPSYRFDRIVELLAATRLHTADSLAAIQRDVRLDRAKRILPRMIGDLEGGTWSAVERQALDLLKAWDGEAGAGSSAASVFQATYREAILAALRDEIDRPGLEFLLSQRYSTNVADLWFDRADHPVWDDRATAATETRADAAQAAFRRAVAYLSAALGPDPAGWQWGRLHRLQIKHAFGSRKSLADFVNLPAVELGGGLDSVWKTHFDLGNEAAPFAVVAGPVYRQIVDLADVRHGRWVIDTGVSGWPGSPHYGDQHEAWKKGETVPMVSDWDEIRATAKAVMVLEPSECAGLPAL
jgi:penicillin amidase